MPLYLTAGLEVEVTEEHVKQVHHRDAISKIQNTDNSITISSTSKLGVGEDKARNL